LSNYQIKEKWRSEIVDFAQRNGFSSAGFWDAPLGIASIADKQIAPGEYAVQVYIPQGSENKYPSYEQVKAALTAIFKNHGAHFSNEGQRLGVGKKYREWRFCE
jgi:hypothetical protein